MKLKIPKNLGFLANGSPLVDACEIHQTSMHQIYARAKCTRKPLSWCFAYQENCFPGVKLV